MSGIDKFLKAIDDVTTFIIGEKRSGDERRVKKPRKRKNEKRKAQRRK